MNNEIKEILNQLEKVKDGVGTFIGIDNKNANLLLDYITNLQTIEQQYSALLSENAELKEVNNYSKRELYKINKDRLEANLKLVKENEKLTEELKGYKQERENLFKTTHDLQKEIKRLENNQRYYKNGVFSLEYDKETMSDMIDDYKSRCEKALDKLYCYGEVFDSKILQVFQKDLENILNGGDKDE